MSGRVACDDPAHRPRGPQDTSAEETALQCCVCDRSLCGGGDTVYVCTHAPPHCRLTCGTCARSHVLAQLGGRADGKQAVPCPTPGCSASMSEEEVVAAAPAEYSQWALSATERLFQAEGYIRCPNPNCCAGIQCFPSDEIPLGLQPTGVPEIDCTLPKPELDESGNTIPPHATLHRLQHRFRCSLCTTEFCDACLATPYHNGMDCAEYAAPRCRYCDTPLLDREVKLAHLSDLPLKELRAAISMVDVSWCSTQEDYWHVYRLTLDCCNSVQCREKLVNACTKPLPCGHECGGVREEQCCLPCLHGCSVPEGSAVSARNPVAKENSESVGCSERAFKPGEEVLYLRGTAREAATVVQVDVSLRPPAYVIRMSDGRIRDTEADRLMTPNEAGSQETHGEQVVMGFTEGDEVMYVEHGDPQKRAKVIKVDTGLDPPSYTIQLESGALRDTEASRLRPASDGFRSCGAAQQSDRYCSEPATGLLSTDCAMCLEPLSRGPAVRLEGCLHTCHLECVRERIRVGCPGPNITFHHLTCPQCGPGGASHSWTEMASTHCVPVSHPAVQQQLQEELALLTQVRDVVKKRIADFGPAAFPQLLPGGKWEGRPVDYALENFLLYKCFRCRRLYYGGQQECVQAVGGNTVAAEDLLCPHCCSADGICPVHGSDYTEWKCRYCCSLATWTCFGGSHMCDTCHERYSRPGGWGSSWQPTHCEGPASCPLRTKHAPNGMEHCLGCGLCRAEAKR